MSDDGGSSKLLGAVLVTDETELEGVRYSHTWRGNRTLSRPLLEVYRVTSDADEISAGAMMYGESADDLVNQINVLRDAADGFTAAATITKYQHRTGGNLEYVVEEEYHRQKPNKVMDDELIFVEARNHPEGIFVEQSLEVDGRIEIAGESYTIERKFGQNLMKYDPDRAKKILKRRGNMTDTQKARWGKVTLHHCLSEIVTAYWNQVDKACGPEWSGVFGYRDSSWSTIDGCLSVFAPMIKTAKHLKVYGKADKAIKPWLRALTLHEHTIMAKLGAGGHPYFKAWYYETLKKFKIDTSKVMDQYNARTFRPIKKDGCLIEK